MGDKTPATTTQNQNSTTTSAPYAAAQPMIDNLIAQFQNAPVGATSNQNDAAARAVNAAAALPSFTPQLTSSINDMFGNAGILRGGYNTLQGNLNPITSPASLDPYATPGFSDAMNTMKQDVLNTTKGLYAGSGRDPSGAGSFAQSFARGATAGMAPAISSQFNANVGNLLNANNTLYNAGNSTVGALDQNTMAALQSAGILPQTAMAAPTAYTQAAASQAALPYQNMMQQLQAAGIFGGMGGTTTAVGNMQGTQTPANNPLANWIGGISGVAGLLGKLPFSDENLKEDIHKVGELHDGQNVYSYRYKGDDVPQIGLLAQEVEHYAPEAVGERAGFKTVNYHTATRKAAQMGMLAA